jgi:bacteriocin biosynthesis cyclodehydratase domain-containing protein
VVLCQDSLDYEEVVRRHRRCREAGSPFLWVSYAALNRAYVSPLFLPDAGPCFVCLLRSFQRLSPAPEIYQALFEHARAGGEFRPAEFPREALLALQALTLWKLGQAEQEQPAAALYRLHVLERATMEVGTHAVLIDPECPECRGGRG